MKKKIKDDIEIVGDVLDIINVPGCVARNPNISLKAKAIFMMVMATGSTKMSDIMSCSTDGRRAVLSGINELIDAGYLSKSESNKSDGKFAGVRYFVDRNKVPQCGFATWQNSIAVESTPYTNIFKLHSSQSDDSEDLPVKDELKKGAGKLPRTDPELTRYLVVSDPSIYIHDETDDDDMLTLSHVYTKDDWELRFATNFWELGQRFNFLTVPQWMRKTLVIQRWADAFNKIIRTKKGTKDQVVMVMKWLMEVDDFWFRTGNIGSPNKFHESYTKDGHNFRFDFFLSRAMIDIPPYPTIRFTYAAGKVEETLKWHTSLRMSDFKKSEGGKYMFLPEQQES